MMHREIQEPGLEIIRERHFTGMFVKMSFSNDHTRELWRSFMPQKNKIDGRTGSELFSFEVYPHDFFQNFREDSEFEKWAALETIPGNSPPEGMSHFVLPSGLYAVFIHRGTAAEGPNTYNYIFRQWMPNSGFLPDNRPHFAVMGEKYRPDDPGSEEEIWIPIQPKK